MASTVTIKELIKALTMASYHQGRATPLSSEWQNHASRVQNLTGELLSYYTPRKEDD